MGRSLTVRQARLVLPDRVVTGDVAVEDGVITEISPRIARPVGLEIDGRNRVMLPGLVDLAVHLETIEDLSALSTAALAGGVTSVIGVGPATTAAELKIELARAVEASRVHCGLYLRATGDNLDEIDSDDRARGIWVPGELLHDERADLLFGSAGRPLLLENANPQRLASRARLYPQSTDPADHSRIHDVDSAVAATRRALELGQKHGRAMILAHVTAAEEVEVLRDRPKCAAAAVCTPHLFLDDAAYAALGTRAVLSPAVRSSRHGRALWDGLLGGEIEVVSSGHRPVRAEWKDRPYPDTVPGMPTVQWTLPLLLDAVHAGRCSLQDVARWTSENPARLLRLPRKGRIETGYDADLVLVDFDEERVVGDSAAIVGAGWAPWQGRTLRGWPVLATVLGEVALRDGTIASGVRGRAL